MHKENTILIGIRVYAGFCRFLNILFNLNLLSSHIIIRQIIGKPK